MIASLIELKTCFVSYSLWNSFYSDVNLFSSLFCNKKNAKSKETLQAGSCDTVIFVISLLKLCWNIRVQEIATKNIIKYSIANPREGAAIAMKRKVAE